MGIDLTVWFTEFGLTVCFMEFDLTVWFTGFDLTVWLVELDLTVWFTGFGLTVYFMEFDFTVWFTGFDLTVWLVELDFRRLRGVASVLSAGLSPASCQSCTAFLTNTIRCWTTLQFKLASTSSRILPLCAQRWQVVAACSVVVDSSSVACGLTVDCITMFLW